MKPTFPENEQLSSRNVFDDPDGKWFDVWRLDRGYYVYIPGLETAIPDLAPTALSNMLRRATSTPAIVSGLLVWYSADTEDPVNVIFGATLEEIADAPEGTTPVFVCGSMPPEWVMDHSRMDFFDGGTPPDAWRFEKLFTVLPVTDLDLGTDPPGPPGPPGPGGPGGPGGITAVEADPTVRPIAAAAQLLRTLIFPSDRFRIQPPQVHSFFSKFVDPSSSDSPKLSKDHIPVFRGTTLARTPTQFLHELLDELARWIKPEPNAERFPFVDVHYKLVTKDGDDVFIPEEKVVGVSDAVQTPAEKEAIAKLENELEEMVKNNVIETATSNARDAELEAENATGTKNRLEQERLSAQKTVEELIKDATEANNKATKSTAAAEAAKAELHRVTTETRMAELQRNANVQAAQEVLRTRTELDTRAHEAHTQAELVLNPQIAQARIRLEELDIELQNAQRERDTERQRVIQEAQTATVHEANVLEILTGRQENVRRLNVLYEFDVQAQRDQAQREQAQREQAQAQREQAQADTDYQAARQERTRATEAHDRVVAALDLAQETDDARRNDAETEIKTLTDQLNTTLTALNDAQTAVTQQRENVDNIPPIENGNVFTNAQTALTEAIRTQELDVAHANTANAAVLPAETLLQEAQKATTKAQDDETKAMETQQSAHKALEKAEDDKKRLMQAIQDAKTSIASPSGGMSQMHMLSVPHTKGKTVQDSIQSFRETKTPYDSTADRPLFDKTQLFFQRNEKTIVLKPTEPLFRVPTTIETSDRFLVVMTDGPAKMGSVVFDDRNELTGMIVQWDPRTESNKFAKISAKISAKGSTGSGTDDVRFSTVVRGTNDYFYHIEHDGSVPRYIGTTEEEAVETITGLPYASTHQPSPLVLAYRKKAS